MKNYAGDLLESHISFLYTSAAKPHLHIPPSSTDHKSIMTHKCDDREERDEIEIGDFTFARGGLEWDTGAVLRDAGSRSKSKRHGILKSLKKPFKRMKRKADQEPLVSKNIYLSTENSTGWTTLKSSGREHRGSRSSSSQSDTRRM